MWWGGHNENIKLSAQIEECRLIANNGNDNWYDLFFMCCVACCLMVKLFIKTLHWHVCNCFCWNANLRVYLNLNTQLD